MPNLSEHTYLGVYEEGDVVLRAYQPKVGGTQRTVILLAFKDGVPVGDREFPLSGKNPFGLDVEDAITLDNVTTDLLKELEDDDGSDSDV